MHALGPQRVSITTLGPVQCTGARYRAIESNLLCCGIYLFHFLCNQKAQTGLCFFSVLSVNSSTRGVTVCYGVKKGLKLCQNFFIIKSGVGNINTFPVCCTDASQFSDKYQSYDK